MTEDETRYIDRIAKLLAKAESTTPEEAEALTAKAEDLMAKYAISQAMLDEKRRAAGHAGESLGRVGIKVGGSYEKPIMNLYAAVVNTTDNVRCYVVMGGKDKIFMLVGYESDVAQMKMLLQSLEIQAAIAMRAWWKDRDTYGMSGSQKWNDRRMFLMGFGNGAAQRLLKVKNANKNEPGTDLVLARGARVDEFMANAVGPLKRGKGISINGGSLSARTDGHRAGLNSNTGETQVTQRGQIG